MFGELLTLPSVTELSSMSSWPSHCSKRFEHPPQAYYRLLELFCLGTFRDYLLRRDALPPLSDAALSKLRQLTILSCAADSADRLLRYDALLEALGLADDVRALEQLTIALLYSGALHARLDQAARCVIVHSAAARDVSPPQVCFSLHFLFFFSSLFAFILFSECSM